jgi:Wiskott-Aldrich syndrome protein
MGFTESAYPNLPSRIKDLLDVNKPLSKDSEDDIVTTLLEELLETTPQQTSPVAGPAPRDDKNIPGAWN